MVFQPDRTEANTRHLSRRQWMSMLGVGATIGLAGCTSPGGDDDGAGNGNGNGNGDGNGDDGGVDEDPDELPDVSGSYDTAVSASIETLNPLYNTEAGAGTAIGRALDMGYTFDRNNEYVPRLYDMWSEDEGEVWVFEVRENLEFSDPYGQVDAESFVYQIQEFHQSEWANSPDGFRWAGANVEQTGEFEFQAELQSPSLLWPETFDPLLYPVPQEIIEPYAADEDPDGLRQEEELVELQFTGNLGPFVLDEWTRGAGTEYVRNDDYYLQDADDLPGIFDNAPYFEGATINVMEEQASRLGALETGEVDTAGIPPEQFQAYDDDPDVSVYQIPQPYNEVISVNMRDNGWNAGPGNLFRYKEFRQALACAIGKEELIAGIYRGLAEPHYTWQPEFTDWFPGLDDMETWGVGDLYGEEIAKQKAQEAIDQSDYDYHWDGDAFVNPDDDQVVLDIYHSAGQDVEQRTGEYVADELEENLGIEVVVEAIDGAAQFAPNYWNAEPAEAGISDTIDGEEVVWENPGPNNPGPRSVTSEEPWDMSLVFGLNTFPRNPMTNQVFFDGANGSYNPVGWYPDHDAKSLWDDARNASDRDELTAAMEQIFVEINREQPYIMLLFDDDLVGYNPDLNGPINDFSNGYDFPAWHFDE